ncbi:MAG: hypothetical protein AB1546_10650 [bacterium]
MKKAEERNLQLPGMEQSREACEKKCNYRGRVEQKAKDSPWFCMRLVQMRRLAALAARGDSDAEKVLRRALGDSEMLSDEKMETNEENRCNIEEYIAADETFSIFNELKIRDKNARIVPLNLNAGQRMMMEAVIKCTSRCCPIRIVLLKARQFGGSTLAQAILFSRSFRRQNRESWVIAHSLASSRYLREISRRFYENLPHEDFQPLLRANESEIVFQDSRSRIRIDTAANLRAGRAFTIHDLHASEVAFWRNADTIMLSLLQSVPDHKDTVVIVESTAAGIGNYFHSLYQNAKEGKNDFIPVFVGWQTVEEYTRSFASGEQKESFASSLDETELALRDACDLTLEQLHWRRWCIQNKCGGSLERFQQEYPSNDIEAFITAGRHVFPVNTLNRRYAVAKPAFFTGEITAEGDLVAVPNGRLKIWEQPQERKHYVLGVDVSEGIEVVSGTRDTDNSSVQVLCREDLEQVACWTGKTDPDALAGVARCIAELYNSAFIGVEANNHGLTTLNELKKRYPYLYCREIFGERSRKVTKKLGWLTTSRTRPLMLDALLKAIRDEILRLNDPDTIGECLTFVYDQDGRMEAMSGCRDDRIIALAIALQMNQSVPFADVKPQRSDPLEKRLELLRRLRSAKRAASADGWTVV